MQFALRRGAGLFIAVRGEHVHAFAEESANDAKADPGCAAGNDRRPWTLGCHRLPFDLGETCPGRRQRIPADLVEV